MKRFLKEAFSRALLTLSPEQYEKRKAEAFGHGYPSCFNATKSIFVHIPKTAGSSIALKIYGRQIGHVPWTRWYELNPVKFKSYFKFAVVRDPISRFVSAFDFLKEGGMNSTDKHFGETALKDFATPNQLAAALIDPGLQSQVLKWRHFLPQEEFIADESGHSKMDMLVRYEDIHKGFAQVLQTLNIAPCELPHLNKTEQRSTSQLEKNALEVLGCIYKKDFTLWENAAAFK